MLIYVFYLGLQIKHSVATISNVLSVAMVNSGLWAFPIARSVFGQGIAFYYSSSPEIACLTYTFYRLYDSDEPR